jgi:hypothetical protein
MSLLLLATTLVALWTPDRVVLGADSLVVLNEGLPKASGCKIAHEGSTFFALSGLVEDQATGLSVQAAATEAARQGGEMPATIGRFVIDVTPKLAKALDLLKREAAMDYEYLKSGRPVLQAIFAGLQNGAPVMATVGFNLDPAGDLRQQTNLVSAGTPRLIYAGQQGRIREYLKTHRDWLSASVIKDLVQLEVDVNSGVVGGPVDLLVLDAKGARWLAKKPECN